MGERWVEHEPGPCAPGACVCGAAAAGEQVVPPRVRMLVVLDVVVADEEHFRAVVDAVALAAPQGRVLYAYGQRREDTLAALLGESPAAVRDADAAGPVGQVPDEPGPPEDGAGQWRRHDGTHGPQWTRVNERTGRMQVWTREDGA